jgi:hypothetical protein
MSEQIEPINPHKRPITPEEIAFCVAYVDSGESATKAYKAVFDADGIPPTLIYAEARKLLKRRDIQKEIIRLKKNRASEKIDPVEILRRNWDISMNFDLGEIFEEGPDGLPQIKPWSRLSKMAKSMIIGIEKEDATVIDGIVVKPAKVRYKFDSKSEYMDRLCKIMKLFDEGVKVEVNNNTNSLSVGDSVALLATIKQRLAEDSMRQSLTDTAPQQLPEKKPD